MTMLDDTAEVPVAFQRDEDGALVLDENGDPIVTQTVPADAYIVLTVEDALEPNRYIDVYASWDNQEPAFGGTVTFVAILNGYDRVEYTLQWQQSSDNVNWTDIDGENNERYSVVVTKDNFEDYWRVEVIITGVAK